MALFSVIFRFFETCRTLAVVEAMEAFYDDGVLDLGLEPVS